MTPSDHAIIAALRSALPEMRLISEPAQAESYRRDETGFLPAGHPLAVAFPKATAEVSSIVRLAAKHSVPVVARAGAPAFRVAPTRWMAAWSRS